MDNLHFTTARRHAAVGASLVDHMVAIPSGAGGSGA
jgi:hypothetical protein